MINFYEYLDLPALPHNGLTFKIIYKEEEYYWTRFSYESYNKLLCQLGNDGWLVDTYASSFFFHQNSDNSYKGIHAVKTIVPKQSFDELEAKINAKIEELRKEIPLDGDSKIITGDISLWKDGKRERFIFNNAEAGISIDLPNPEIHLEELENWIFYFSWANGSEVMAFNYPIYYNQGGKLRSRQKFLPTGNGNSGSSVKMIYKKDIGYFLID